MPQKVLAVSTAELWNCKICNNVFVKVLLNLAFAIDQFFNIIIKLAGFSKTKNTFFLACLPTCVTACCLSFWRSF